MTSIQKMKCALCGTERYRGEYCPDCGCDELEIKQCDVSNLLARRTHGLDCAACGENLTGHPVQAYAHEGGWFAGPALPFTDTRPPRKIKWWFSIKCPSPSCNYETSFDKLGIKR